jgi:hypothetical protein
MKIDDQDLRLDKKRKLTVEFGKIFRFFFNTSHQVRNPLFEELNCNKFLNFRHFVIRKFIVPKISIT